MREPPLPTVGWDVFELITPLGEEPHWTPRGGHVSSEPPDAERMKLAALQASGKLVAVRYRIEPETRIDVEFEAEALPELPERAVSDNTSERSLEGERQQALFKE